MSEPTAPPAYDPPPLGKPVRFNFAWIQSGLMALLVVISAGQSVYLLTYASEQRRVLDRVECQAQLSEAIRISLNERAPAAAADRKNLRDYFQKATDNFRRNDTAGQVRALNEFYAAQRKADEDRNNTPIPQRKC